MKKQSRLTALLLALCMLMSTLPVSALADGILTLEDYLSAVQRVQQELSESSIPVEEENAYTLTRTTTTETIVRETVTGELSGEGESAFTLPVAGKLELSTAAAADAYQWQIDVGGVWANIVGDTAAAVTLTYAKVQNALSGGTARVRCAMTQDGQTVYSAVATVTVDETVKTQTVEGTEEISAVSYTSEAPRSLARTLNAGVGTYANDPTPTSYTIVVQYVFSGGQQAANPWTATVPANEPFTATVKSPSVLGYATTAEQETVTINIASVTQNETYTVTYYPAKVNFTVNHYWQNVTDDNYTFHESENKTWYTESKVGEGLQKDYAGFYALLYDTDQPIAADSTTEVKIYYDRNYYLMNFDLGGGYGVEPIYARYGAPISVPTEDEEGKKLPIKAGYTFSGWTLDGTNTVDLPDTMPAENRTYKAVWTPDATAKVTIVFWGENADNEEYSYIKSIQTEQTPGTAYSVNGSSYVHQHAKTCYGNNIGNEVSNRYSIVGKETEGYIGEYGNEDYWGDFIKKGNCIYINGTWYVYTGNAEAGSTLSAECGYLNKALWTWVGTEPESVTVAADGSTVVNVYYDRTEKTLTFNYNYKSSWGSGRYQSTETITAKWGSNISEQYKKIAANAGSTFWSASQYGTEPYTNYFGVMPQTSATYYNQGDTGGDGTMTYWGQDLNGKYTVKLFEVTGVGGYYVSDEDRYEFEGFTCDRDRGAKNGDQCGGAKFYYNRNSYNLTFNAGYNDVETKTVKYEAPLSEYSSYVPGVPSAYEPGSVTFGGWYLNPECTGKEYKLDEHTMPADNVLLYAKWVPVTHTVTFYLDKDAYIAETPLESHPERKVLHNSKLDPVPETPKIGEYTFIGWFYMDGEEEKAIDFANMPIKKDLQVYGKWKANVQVDYVIKYAVKNADGTLEYIAADTTGKALVGVDKTFEAKTGTELNAEYQEGFFPETGSHSMTISIEPSENEYTFIYVEKDSVPYTVKYLEKGTNKVLHEEKTRETKNAIITETYVPYTGYRPDAYQKKLVLSANEKNNVIIFWYEQDTVHAPVHVIHWVQNIEGEGYTIELETDDMNGEIGKGYTVDILNLTGFTYYHATANKVAVTAADSKVTGKVAENGLLLELFYNRNEYPYEFRFLEQGTDKVLHDPVAGNARYEAQVPQSALSIPGYTCVSDTQQAMTILVEADKNVRTFYYTENEVTINYKMVGPEGTVSEKTSETYGSITSASETLKVLTGKAQGSTATAADGYRFVGWYTDAECTAQNLVSTNAEYVPTQPSHTDNGETVKDPWVAATYYAKFEYNLTTLTVTKKGLNQSTTEDCESAIFTVKDSSGKLVARFALQNNDSAVIDRLTVGETYTVTEENSWTWRYASVPAQTKMLVADPNQNKVEFTNTQNQYKWLGGDNYKTNVFGE